MAHLICRNDTYYICYLEGGKERRTSLKTSLRSEAKTKLRDWEVANDRPGGSKVTKTPIATVVEAYVQHLKISQNRSTTAQAINVLRRAFGEVSPSLVFVVKMTSLQRKSHPDGKMPVIRASYFEEITSRHISDWIREMSTGFKWVATTTNKKRMILYCLWKWALGEHGLRISPDDVQLNPVMAVKKHKEREPIITWLNRQQIAYQFDAFDKPVDYGFKWNKERQTRMLAQLRAMVAVYIYSGLRLAECLHLQLSDIELGDGTNGYGVIRVRPKTFAGGSWQPKTGRSRVIPISSMLHGYLKEYIPRVVPGSWFFPSPTGRRWNTINFEVALRSFNQRHGLEWSAIDYRHTFGSILAQANVSLFRISKLMGNSPEIVRKHYAVLITEDMGHEVELMDGNGPRPVKAVSQMSLVG